MNKPSTITKVELEKKISDAVYESGLPAFVVAYMFEGFLADLRKAEKQQYEADLKAWEEIQKGNGEETA